VQDREPLGALGFQRPPGNERRVLVLVLSMFSLDALNWFQAGFVAVAPSPFESFSCTSQLVARKNLLIIPGTSAGGSNQHDRNLITLHRVRAFRSLAPGALMPGKGNIA